MPLPGADATWDTAPAESVSAQEDAHSSPGPTRRLSGADDGAPPASLAVTSFEIVSDGAVSSKVRRRGFCWCICSGGTV